MSLDASKTPEPAVDMPELESFQSTPLQARPASSSHPDAFAFQVAAPAPPVRERPQDAQPQPRPWTSRSYAASKTAIEEPVAGPRRGYPWDRPQIAAPVGNSATVIAPPPRRVSAATIFQPPQSFLLQEAVAPVLRAARKHRYSAEGQQATAISACSPIAAAALILAAGIVGSLMSRQNLKASQNKDPIP